MRTDAAGIVGVLVAVDQVQKELREQGQQQDSTNPRWAQGTL
jgi:hypothetical protein